MVDSTCQHLSGSIEQITFHNPENGFSVFQVKVSGWQELVSVVGYVMHINPGEYVDCYGGWVNNHHYGQQFQAKECKTIAPSTIEGMQKYLGSGLIKGIGPHFAKKLISTFKDKVFDIIEHHSERLLEIEGIGQGRRSQIIEAWDRQKTIRDIIVFLQSYGLGTALAARVYKYYGNDAISILQKNPYKLTESIVGVGFKKADALAQHLGIALESSMRVQAGLQFVLLNFQKQGHCAAAYKDLIKQTTDLLEVSEDLVAKVIEENKQNGSMIEEAIADIDCIFSKRMYEMECSVAKQVYRILKGRFSLKVTEVESALSWVQQRSAYVLSSSQCQAVRLVLMHKVSIITGGPGVGKTTVLKSILAILSRKTEKIALCAPTGRAAKRLYEATGKESKTIHRLLAFDPKHFGFKYHENNPLNTDFLVVDEASMIDLRLMLQLLKAIPLHAGLLLVGDVDQLPSVGAGRVLSDMIQSKVLPTVHLCEIFRQAEASQIVLNAHRVNQGKMPLFANKTEKLSDFYWIATDSPESIQRIMIQLITKRIPQRFGFHARDDIQVLTPMHNGMLGTKALNRCLQEKINANAMSEVQRFGTLFKQGDKVIQRVNNYDRETYNGDIGIISHIDHEAETLFVLFEKNPVGYSFSDLDELNLAYACSVHKSQGSEYPAVIIPVTTQHYTLLQRNLLYTAMTRAKALVVLIGQYKALAIAVHQGASSQRLTNLASRLNRIKAS